MDEHGSLMDVFLPTNPSAIDTWGDFPWWFMVNCHITKHIWSFFARCSSSPGFEATGKHSRQGSPKDLASLEGWRWQGGRGALWESAEFWWNLMCHGTCIYGIYMYGIYGVYYSVLYGIYIYMTGWWLTYPSQTYEFVSWDDDIPNWMESHKIPWFQTTNQMMF